MKKSIIAVLLILSALTFMLCGCGEKQNNNDDSKVTVEQTESGGIKIQGTVGKIEDPNK